MASLLILRLLLVDGSWLEAHGSLRKARGSRLRADHQENKETLCRDLGSGGAAPILSWR